jgi:hypothetical protein
MISDTFVPVAKPNDTHLEPMKTDSNHRESGTHHARQLLLLRGLSALRGGSAVTEPARNIDGPLLFD